MWENKGHWNTIIDDFAKEIQKGNSDRMHYVLAGRLLFKDVIN